MSISNSTSRARCVGLPSQIRSMGPEICRAMCRTNTATSFALIEWSYIRKYTSPSSVTPLIAEMRPPLSGNFTTGVSPTGAHPRLTCGDKSNPLSSTKISVEPRSSAFFYTRPLFVFPFLYRRFVALSGTLHRLLRTESHLPQQFSYVAGMVTYSVTIFDQLRHHRACPKLGLEAEVTRTSQQQFAEIVEIFRRDLLVAPTRRMTVQRLPQPPREPIYSPTVASHPALR